MVSKKTLLVIGGIMASIVVIALITYGIIEATGSNEKEHTAWPRVVPKIPENKAILIASRSSEAVPLDLPENQTCTETLPVLPERMAFGMAFMDGDNPVICRGNLRNNMCYRLTAAPYKWERHSSRLRVRLSPAFAQMGNDWWLLGGSDTQYTAADCNSMGYDDIPSCPVDELNNNSFDNSTTEIWDSTQSSWVAGPDMPFADCQSCAAAINSTHLIVSGGQNVFILNIITKEWTKVESMKEKRHSHACGVTYGGAEYIVTGGYIPPNDQTGNYLNSSEILDLKTLQWRDGPALPYTVSYATAVPYGDTFLVVGGDGGRSRIDRKSIFQYDVNEESWVEREERLKRGNFNPMVTLVDNDFIECKKEKEGN